MFIYELLDKEKFCLLKLVAVNTNNLPSIKADVCALILKMEELKNIVDELKKQVNVLTAGSTSSLIDKHLLVSYWVKDSSCAHVKQL